MNRRYREGRSSLPFKHHLLCLDCYRWALVVSVWPLTSHLSCVMR